LADLKFNKNRDSTNGSRSSSNRHLMKLCGAASFLQIELAAAAVGTNEATSSGAPCIAGPSMKPLIEVHQHHYSAVATYNCSFATWNPEILLRVSAGQRGHGHICL
jgi:hypothetical protein